ncbi:hypothetical protein RvY_17510 [Ramazzottius varieornatus]|uniref:Methyltransferase-like protein 4 n=1 Tax=Ramazzottius varieornatus TaxID=947166 RepID=A0A1D1W2Q5_RAMVA|nr:hypothetical protein RvY_17510 [Ramazzottius varieornatus]
MAITLKSDGGFVLDMEQLMRTVLKDTRDFGLCHLPNYQTSLVPDTADAWIQSMQFKPAMFNLKAPFMMDSEFRARQANLTSGATPVAVQSESLFFPQPDYFENRTENITTAFDGDKAVEDAPTVSQKKRKRRRREPELNEEDGYLQSATADMVSALPNYFTNLLSKDMDNNLSYRAVSTGLLSAEKPELETGRCYDNLLSHPTIVSYGLERYIIPASCRYFSSAFSDVDCLLNDGRRYDFLVVDPPWDNKSAKRLKKYDFLPEEELLKIPFKELSCEGALLALWITNNVRTKNFVEERLLPAWGAVKEAEWTWVKVTRSGEAVCSFSSRHKKPYEKLVFARMGKRGEGVEAVADGKVMVSIPSAVHSHKPSLYEVAKMYLPERAECLELFARSLTPGWTSWGLQVLKLQNTRLYEASS